MKVTTRITWNIETGEVLEHIWHGHDGEVALLKGGQSKKAAAAAEQQRQEQNAIMREQLALQRDAIRNASAYATPAGEGFSPEALAAMRTQALEGTTAAFEDARQQMVRALTARGGAGGELPVGGDFLRNLGTYNAALAQARSRSLQDVNIQNAMQALQNRFASGNLLLGVGSQYSPAPYISGASSALNARVGAAQNADAAGTGIWGSLLGGGFGLLGTALSPGGVWNRR